MSDERHTHIQNYVKYISFVLHMVFSKWRVAEYTHIAVIIKVLPVSFKSEFTLLVAGISHIDIDITKTIFEIRSTYSSVGCCVDYV